MKIKKVLLIHSGHHDSQGRVIKAKKILDKITVANVAELGLPLIAAYTPKNIHVEKVEDYFEDIPYDTDAQVIGISAQVMQLSRALELAKEFKKRGKIVIMGGFLPTMHPEKVSHLVDSICQGEGDRIWPQILKDIESGQLKKSYRADTSQPIDQIPVPRYDLIRRDRFTYYPVQATRGCPFTWIPSSASYRFSLNPFMLFSISRRILRGASTHPAETGSQLFLSGGITKGSTAW